ncbi:hypothetical protein HUK82_08045, partial [Ameyamaea chiangmaiensis]|nr:hypothetical protein [Ameyamaea chiangmaiensis]
MTRQVSEERHGLRLTGGKTYAARLSIPRERWADVGRAYGTRTGVRQELVRSTQTRDRHEAIRRRGKVLERLRAEVDAKLAAIGLPPLHGTWCPDWMTEERLVADAL